MTGKLLELTQDNHRTALAIARNRRFSPSKVKAIEHRQEEELSIVKMYLGISTSPTNLPSQKPICFGCQNYSGSAYLFCAVAPELAAKIMKGLESKCAQVSK